MSCHRTPWSAGSDRLRVGTNSPGPTVAAGKVIVNVPAVEVMRVTPYIRECIENKDKTKYIREQIALGTSQYGMQTFDQSLFSLYKAGLITLEEALKRATNPDEFKLKIQGIQSTADMAREEMDASLEAPNDFNPLQEESPFDFSNQPPGRG